MDTTNQLWAVLLALASRAPVLLVWTVGGALALSQLRQRQRRAVLALLGLGIMVVLTVVMVPVNVALPPWALDQGWTPEQLGAALTVVGGIGQLVAMVAWSLIVAAIFVRDPAPEVD